MAKTSPASADRLQPASSPAAAQTASPASAISSIATKFFASAAPLYLTAALLRIALLAYGSWQDAHSAVKYTDVDYLVFTDAARLVSRGLSPYRRETYRYTPLLAWLLLPTARGGRWWFGAGKALFAAADLVAGRLLERVLLATGVPAGRARRFAAVWLLNPMVATISTRGSSEGLLGAVVAALVWAVLARRVGLAGALLGVAVHLKIYPFIYAPAIVWWMDDERLGRPVAAAEGKMARQPRDGIVAQVRRFATPARVRLAVVSLGTFCGLNLLMFSLYGFPFVTHTYLHHVTRIDHRHNFSPYNVLLYLTSASPNSTGWRIESVAFLPQLLLSCVLIPLATAKKDLPSTMLAQTFAFVTFNKVCTSQYFLWYMIFLPLYLPRSSLLRNPRRGLVAVALWVAGQAAWLQQGYALEFLGRSVFVPGLWAASLVFFGVNCWILGIIIGDMVEA